jgi:hypothetical protein
MKPNEVRIGNLIYVNNEISKIWLLNDQAEESPNVKPIPITDEWLVKFGFELHYGRYYKGNFCYYPDLKMFEWRGLPLLDSLWNEVHKLQNLHFALTGQELTIK